ncbi:MAG: chain length determinant protein [Sphaerisporangium sp.]|nr:chain length determinant protein [Sphaerisporangium sp.]
MDLLDSLRALLRRWPVTVALMAVTLAATVGALIAIPWQYESKATVVFLSSRKGSQPVGGNPWLAFDASLTITAEVIARNMSDERTLQKLKDEGNTATFTVGLAQDSRGPLLDITATGPDPKVAQATMDTLVTLSQARLTEMQRKSAIVPDATIRAELVTSTDKAQVTPQAKIRLLVIIFAGGMLLTIGVPLFLESMAQKRRRQAQSGQVTSGAGHPPTGPSHPQRASRSAGGAAPRPGGGPMPGSRPPARPPRPIEPPPAGPYDRRVPSTAKNAPPPEPRDPWANQQRTEENLYVWSDDKERPQGAPPSGPAPRSKHAAGNGGKPGQGPQPASRSGRPTLGGPDDEPYVVFDPTRPGR